MVRCRHCSQPVDPRAKTCPHCDNLGPISYPTDEPASGQAGHFAPADRIFIAGVSLALGLTDVARMLTQPFWFAWQHDDPVARTLQPWQLQTLNFTARYLLPALVFYALLRMVRAERWLRPKPATKALLWTGVGLFLIYGIPRALAGMIPGGGPAYVMATFSLLFIVPAYVLCIAAGVQLVRRSGHQAFDEEQKMSFTRREATAVAVAVAVMAIPVASLFVGADSPYGLARAARNEFTAKCQAAGERLLQAPSRPVRGVFVDRESSAQFGHINRGSFGSASYESVGDSLVSGGYVLFFERPAHLQAGSGAQYTRHLTGDRRGAPVAELESEYGVFWRDLTSPQEKQRGLEGFEVSVRDLGTSAAIAASTYFAHRRLRHFCGHAPDRTYREDLWVVRVLNLRPQTYPAARN